MRRIFISFFLSILLLKYGSSQDGSPCQTKASLDPEAGETCAQLEASEDHYCIPNPETGEGEKPCKEADACNLLEPVDGSCAGLKTHNDNDKYVCKVSTEDETKCIELTKCEGETLETFDVSLFIIRLNYRIHYFL